MTNLDLQNRLLPLLESGCTVLAESQRFVHQVQRQFRLKRIEHGKSGWDTPKIYTLNRWMENFWTDSWPEELPASSFLLRWRYLKEILDETQPPEPVSAGLELVQLLDESFEQCLRYGIDPAGSREVSRMFEWRAEVWRSFEQKLAATGLFHPAKLPAGIIGQLASLERPADSAKMAFVGFEFAGDWEKRLLYDLQKKFGAVFFALPAGDALPERLVYSDPEQEIIGLMENLLASLREHAPHEIAVVLGDSEFYGPAVSNQLLEILGEPVRGEWAAYNLCPDPTMSGHSLYSAAVMPMRFALSGEKRGDLFSFLCSPYYGFFSRWNRRLSLWDKNWRQRGAERGLDLLLSEVSDNDYYVAENASDIRYSTTDAPHPAPDVQHLTSEIRKAIAPFLAIGMQAVSKWTEALRHAWKSLEFPVLANELDQITWENLVQIISELETVIGDSRLDAREFLEILGAAAGRTRIQKSGFEDAGIQVISRLDARGLFFRKIFIPGMVSGSFPQPARSLPLLSSSERLKVLGGAIESQFAFAGSLYSNLLAAAPQIVLSRPLIAQDGEIRIPSPFWIKEGEREIEPVIPWRHELPAMQRARWVQQSFSEASVQSPVESVKSSCEPDASEFQIQLPPGFDSISVSQLQSALLCPARFFFQHFLGLETLAEFEPGITPLERGRCIHAILALFVSRAMQRLKESRVDREDLAGLLKKTVLDVVGPRLHETIWQVEYERLTGESGLPGLLLKWLDAEWDKMLDGWSWTAVERPFEGLRINGCKASLKGRLDRIDSHPEHGMICWDYKTGKLPRRTEVIGENTQPQLPAYLFALSRGKVAGTPKTAENCGAGFVELSSPGNMKHQVVFDPGEDHDAFLKGWEKDVSAVLNSIFAGDLSPRRLKEGRPCKEQCEFKGVCL
jgi:RecB family exonuclease